MFGRLTLLLAFGLVAAGNRKCAPDKWQADLIGKTVKVVNGTSQIFNIKAKSYTDYFKRKEVYIETMTGPETITGERYSSNITLITDFNKMKTYEIHPNEEKCIVRDVPEGRNLELPCPGNDGLKKLYSFKLGGKMADFYRMTFHNTTKMMTVMRENFSPVSTIIERNIHGVPEMIGFQYGNVSTDIEDDDVFNVPSYCQKRKQKVRVCAPEQWEAEAIGQMSKTDLNNNLVVVTTRHFQFTDFKNKLEVSTFLITDGKETEIFFEYIDWNQGLWYRARPAMRRCEVRSPPHDHMINLCSDSDDLHYHETLMVDGKEAVTYMLNPGQSLKSFLTVFSDSFEPISSLSENIGNQLPQITAVQFANFTVGIKNRSVFTVPDYC